MGVEQDLVRHGDGVVRRLRAWLWRVMHRRVAERLDRYVGER